jgi:tellurite methyltransferase
MSDKTYWKTFYENGTFERQPHSNFCQFVMDFFENKNITTVLDVGCGDGRDSYFISTKYHTTGVENCGVDLTTTSAFNFINADFITIDKRKFDLIYSRFTFHSITNEDHQIFIDTIQPNTYLAIEARSSKGIDNQVFHGKTHYRNYINLEYITKLLLKNNFEILFIKEDIDMAIYKTENPICIRVICKKRIV